MFQNWIFFLKFLCFTCFSLIFWMIFDIVGHHLESESWNGCTSLNWLSMQAERLKLKSKIMPRRGCKMLWYLDPLIDSLTNIGGKSNPNWWDIFPEYEHGRWTYRSYCECDRVCPNYPQEQFCLVSQRSFSNHQLLFITLKWANLQFLCLPPWKMQSLNILNINPRWSKKTEVESAR